MTSDPSLHETSHSKIFKSFVMSTLNKVRRTYRVRFKITSKLRSYKNSLSAFGSNQLWKLTKIYNLLLFPFRLNRINLPLTSLVFL